MGVFRHSASPPLHLPRSFISARHVDRTQLVKATFSLLVLLAWLFVAFQIRDFQVASHRHALVSGQQHAKQLLEEQQTRNKDENLKESGSSSSNVTGLEESVQGGADFFLPGQLWLDSKGSPIQAHGGSIMYDESSGRFFWYGENKDGETYKLRNSLARVDFIGISAYSSSDLLHWTYHGLALKSDPSDVLSDLHPSRVAERPKVVFHPESKQYVMWLHVDDADYNLASLGVATSTRPEGPFQYSKRLRPHGFDSRDMTIFRDDDGSAYIVYSSEVNSVLHIGRLSSDYFNLEGACVRRLVGWRREAPAVFKYHNHYFMITSGCTGWLPNAAQVHVASDMMGEWEQLTNPCVADDKDWQDRTFDSQGTYVLPLPGGGDTFLFMADRWRERDLKSSMYVWLPLVVEDFANVEDSKVMNLKERFRVKIEWQEKWKLPSSILHHLS